MEQVRLTVPSSDDHSLEALTIRTWVLGGIACVLQAVFTAFFSLRQNTVTIPLVCVQIAVLPIGKLMASAIPIKVIEIPGTRWTFSTNPGPFNMKEHALISIFASTGTIIPYAVEIIIALKAFYHKGITITGALMITLSTQLIGYGFAGFFIKFLVDSPRMPWPSTLVDVAFYRTFHDDETRPVGQITRIQFFKIATVCSFAYSVIPGYLFPSVSALSLVCLIWRDSVTAQQLGAGRNGLGLGSFGLDWQTITGYTGDPLSTPEFVVHNTMGGFLIAYYVVAPLGYYMNFFDAKKFSIFSSHAFDAYGQPYNFSRVIKKESFTFDESSYRNYSKVYLSIFLAYSYGLRFASISAALVHVGINHGRAIWKSIKDGYREHISGVGYTRLTRGYEPIPWWWFCAILVSMFLLAIFGCHMGLEEANQLPFWSVALACGIGLILTLPIAVIYATTTQTLLVSVIAELVIGYLNPGKPVPNMIFKNYVVESLNHAVHCLDVLKFGHYLKLDPRSVFIVLVMGSAISACVHLGTLWVLLTTVKDICHPDMLPKGSPWTCPSGEVFYYTSAMWGLIGPSNLFAPHGNYTSMYFFIPFGAVATVVCWKISKIFHEKNWLRLIHVPVILSAVSTTPPGGAVNFWSWYVAASISIYVFNNHKGWWARFNYVLSASLAAGGSFTALLLYFTLNSNGIYGPEWWGLEVADHCPLAHCPTAPGIVVDGCPVFN